METFFSGRRYRGGFVQIDRDNGAAVRVKVYARWLDIQTSSTAYCGDTCEISLSRSVGLSRKDTETLMTGFSGSIGAEAIAQMKAKMEATLSSEIAWDERDELTQKFGFTAPECGSRTDSIYQLLREYELWFAKRTFFGGLQTRQHLLTEHTRVFHAFPDIQKIDEKCHCPSPPKPLREGLLDWNFGSVSLRTVSNWTTSGIEVYAENKPVRFERLPRAFEFSARWLPPYFSFLTDTSQAKYVATLSPVAEEPPESWELDELTASKAIELVAPRTEDMLHQEAPAAEQADY